MMDMTKLDIAKLKAAYKGKWVTKLGALDYKECVGDELAVKGMRSFTKLARLKRGETVIFSWITYKTKAHRNAVNKKVMKDPAIQKMMHKKMPFDPKRMSYGGFRVIVDNPR